MNNQPPSSGDRTPDDDALFDEIVAAFGDRPSGDLLEPDERSPDVRSDPPSTPTPLEWWEREPEGFVPPEPPPLPRPEPLRMAAWICLLGGPVMLIGSAVFAVGLPRVVILLTLAAILASFGYLLWTSPATPREPWEDGAQV